MPLPEADWLGFCRRAAEGARSALARYPSASERAVETGRGEGGDTTLVIDRAAEDAIFGELEALGVPLTAVSEERGELAIAGGGPAHARCSVWRRPALAWWQRPRRRWARWRPGGYGPSAPGPRRDAGWRRAA